MGLLKDLESIVTSTSSSKMEIVSPGLMRAREKWLANLRSYYEEHFDVGDVLIVPRAYSAAKQHLEFQKADLTNGFSESQLEHDSYQGTFILASYYKSDAPVLHLARDYTELGAVVSRQPKTIISSGNISHFLLDEFSGVFVNQGNINSLTFDSPARAQILLYGTQYAVELKNATSAILFVEHSHNYSYFYNLHNCVIFANPFTNNTPLRFCGSGNLLIGNNIGITSDSYNNLIFSESKSVDKLSNSWHYLSDPKIRAIAQNLSQKISERMEAHDLIAFVREEVGKL